MELTKNFEWKGTGWIEFFTRTHELQISSFCGIYHQAASKPKKDVGADIEIDTAPTDMSGRWMMRLLNLPTRQSSQNMTTDDGRFTKGPHRRFGEKV